MSGAVIVAAKRTSVAPRGGALKMLEAWELGAQVIVAVLHDAGIEAADVERVVMGNALYGGGNPARLAALRAGVPQTVPAVTIDTQCCSGLDAIAEAAALIDSGRADIVVAGGLESYSRAPIRTRRPKSPGEMAEAYERPPFSPWPDRDPDMLASAAALAETAGISRAEQDAYAVESHRRALADALLADELSDVAGLAGDTFARQLSAATCARLPVLAGGEGFGLTSATTAVEADAAAAVLVMSAGAARAHDVQGRAVPILATASVGGDPAMPALTPIAAAHAALAQLGLHADEIDIAEIMEAFAVQAMTCIDGIGLDPARVNRRGGALARGHPVGASGAILAVRLWHDIRRHAGPSRGLCAIAAAGGLGSAMIMGAPVA